MNSVSGLSGTWLGLAADNAWALVELGERDPRETRLLDALREADLSSAIDALAASGISATPHFAMAAVDGDTVRYVVRGAGSVFIITEGGGHSVDGRNSPTWIDAYAPEAVVGIRLSAPSVGEPEEVYERGRLGGLTVRLGAEVQTPALASPTAVTQAPEVPHDSVFFDLLMENTTTRDALAQSLSDLDEEAETVAPAPPVQSVDVPERVSGETATWEGTSSWMPTPPGPTAPDPGGPAVSLTSAESPSITQGGGIIESLPWETPARPPGSAATALPPTSPATFLSAPTPASPAPTAGGRAVAPVPPPYVPPAAPGSAVSADAVSESPDATRRRAELVAMLREPVPAGPTVLAVVCLNRHLSSPYAPACRICGAAIPEQQPRRIARPSLGRLVLSTGAAVNLDKGVVFGRSPQTTADGAARPNLIKLDAAEISRQHAEVRLEDWQVLLRDLGSGNGTTITLPGRAAELIRPRVDYALEPGTVIGIADIVTVMYEVTA